MKAKGIAFDPTLSVVEGFTDFAKGDTSLLKRSLVAASDDRKNCSPAPRKRRRPSNTRVCAIGLSHYPISVEIGIEESA